MIERLSRIVLASGTVWMFSAAYTQQSPNDLFAIVHFPTFALVPLAVADAALFALVMIAQLSQLRSILRCYAYAGHPFQASVFAAQGVFVY